MKLALLQKKRRPKTFLNFLGASADFKELLPDMYNAAL
jgi:hypothetical protein